MPDPSLCRHCGDGHLSHRCPEIDAEMWEQVEEGLAQVYKPEGVRTWLRAEHKQWDGWTVSEMFNHGRGDEVLAVVDQLVTGAFA